MSDPLPRSSHRRYPLTWVVLALALTAACALWFGFHAPGAYALAHRIKSENLRLEHLRGTIIHLDEVLTMSARMAATTGDRQWEARYRQFEPALDKAIKEMMRLIAGTPAASNAAVTDAANQQLVAMEHDALALAAAGRLEQARAIIFSDDYEKQKARYLDGLLRAMTWLDGQIEASLRSERAGSILTILVSTGALLATLVAWLIVVRKTFGVDHAPAEDKPVAPPVAHETTIAGRFRLYALAGSAAIFLLGLAVLAGWCFDIAALKSVWPGLATMKPNTALAFVLAGLALWLKTGGASATPKSEIRSLKSLLSSALAAAVALLGALTLSQDATGLDLGMDQWLFRDAPGAAQTAAPGRMSPATAFNFMLAGLGLLCLDARTRRGHWPAQWFAAGVFLISMVALLGYLYGVEALYQVRPFTSMALHTAAAFLLFSTAVFLSRPQLGLVAAFVNHGPRGLMVRRLLLPTLFAPVLAGWLRLAGQRAGLFGAEFGLTLMVTFCIAICAVLLWWTSESLYRADLQRGGVEAALRESEGRLRQVLDGLPVAAYTCDNRGLITYFNAAAVEAWGRAPKLDDATDVFCGSFKLWRPDGAPVPHNQCWMAVALTEHRPVIGHEIVIERPDGSRRLVLAHANPLCDTSGQVNGAVNVLVDITARKEAEEALRKKDEAYRAVVRSTHDGFWLVDGEGRVLDVNEAYCRLSGYRREQLLAMRISDVEAAESPEGTRRHIEKILATGSDVFETRHRCADGRIVDLEVSASLMSKEDGRLSAFFRDITERKRAGDLVRASELKYRTLLENLPQRIFLKDRNSAYLSCNRNFARDLGVAPEELAGRTDRDFFPPDLAERYRAGDRRVMETGVTEELEEPHVHGGREMWVRTVKTPVRNEAGECAGVLGIFWDVTEQRQAEQERQRLFAAVEHVPETIIITDVSGAMVYVNPAFEQKSGYTRAEVLGQSPRLLKSGQLPAAFYEELWSTLARGTAWDGIFINKRKDGAIYCEEATVAPVRDAAGQIVHYVSVQRDITERLRAEEAQRRHTEEMEQFNQLAVGRELRMVELKQRVNDLCRQLGQPAPYNLGSAIHPTAGDDTVEPEPATNQPPGEKA